MDAPQSQKGRVDIDLENDYISNLPADVKEKILVNLPIKEMVRTSVLSSKWLDSWISVPNLVFEEKCIKSELVKLVEKVLLVHQGPIEKFKLVSDHACSEAIGCWLLNLSKNGIKDLELLFNDKRCKIPFRLFSCLALERLYLIGCSIKFPPCFQGFKLLRALILSKFHLSGIGIKNMISSCPLLDHLRLSYFVLRGYLHICALNLTSLDICGEFRDICLETPKLTTACIDLINTTGDYRKSVARNRKESNIIRALGHLPNIQQLDICGEFCNYLAIGPMPENHPTVFNLLTDIYMHLYVNPNEIAAALCLFEKAPNLEKLSIEFICPDAIDQPNVEAAWEAKALRDRLFKHLSVVYISYGDLLQDPKLTLQTTKSIVGFAKLVLSTAPVLEKLNFLELGDATIIFQLLYWFPKLSKKAGIFFG